MKDLKGTKILLAVTNDLTYDRRMARICTALSEAGANVLLVGRRRKHSVPFKHVAFNGARLKCWWNQGPMFYMEYNLRLFVFMLFSSYDIACACDLDTAPAVRLASRVKRRKTAYDAHEYFTEVPELSGRPVVKGIWKWIARRTIPGFDLHYTVGEELARIMGAKYGVLFHVVRNIEPVMVNDPKPSYVLQREKILLYQGAINVGRGLETILQAMTVLPDWRFWLAGEGDITSQLKELSDRLNVNDRVSFLGWIIPSELPALLQKARLAINLREAGSLNDYYSLPNKFFDAIHAGLPSINMDFPEYSAIGKRYPCSILIHRVDKDEIVDAIRFLDAHPEQLQAMTEACHDAAQEFTWEKESKRLVDLYITLVTAGKGT